MKFIRRLFYVDVVTLSLRQLMLSPANFLLNRQNDRPDLKPKIFSTVSRFELVTFRSNSVTLLLSHAVNMLSVNFKFQSQHLHNPFNEFLPNIWEMIILNIEGFEKSLSD